jgi:hypothetical protein
MGSELRRCTVIKNNLCNRINRKYVSYKGLPLNAAAPIFLLNIKNKYGIIESVNTRIINTVKTPIYGNNI